MVELRKRSAPAPAAPPPAKRTSSTSKVKKVAEKVKSAVTGGTSSASETATGGDNAVVDGSGVLPETTGTAGGVTEELSAPATNDGDDVSANKLGKENVGQQIKGDGFGGVVTTHDGTETRLATLLEGSKMGVVVFTYPKASTPGCTTQACLFRDAYAPITSAGYSVYGLSTDSAKSNTTFVDKHSLPYPLLCDSNATLTSAIGMKKPGPGKSTTRGVVVIDKEGTVKLWEQAGPQKTLDVVLDFLKKQGTSDAEITAAASGVVAPPPTQVSQTELGKSADPFARLKFDEAPLIVTPTNEEAEAANTAAEVGVSAARVHSMEEEKM